MEFKGHPKRNQRNVKQIQIHPRGKHSAKPPKIRDEIMRLAGDLPKIELFACEKVEGWDAWRDGIDQHARNEIGQDILF